MRRQPERSPTLFGWLVTVAEREAWRLAARGRRTIDLDELPCPYRPTIPGPEDVVEARNRFEHAAAAMTARQRRILGLHAAGLSYRQISEATGETLRTAERQMHRGRRRARTAARSSRLGDLWGLPKPRRRGPPESSQGPEIETRRTGASVCAGAPRSKRPARVAHGDTGAGR